MALFNAEAIMIGVLKQMGVTPDQIVELLTAITGAVVMVREIHAELKLIQADREGFRTGSAYVVSDFRERLARMEAQLATLSQGNGNGQGEHTEHERGDGGHTGHVNGKAIGHDRPDQNGD